MSLAKLSLENSRSFKTTDLEARLKAQEEFFRLMSHEIRTPLNGVLGMLSLLQKTHLSAEQANYVETARQSGDHLISLVNDLLDYARIDAGYLSLEPTVVALEPLLQTVAELLSPRAFQNHIEIVWSLDPNLSTVTIDEGRIKQILYNLAGNAIKFTKSGGVHIHIGLSAQGKICFSVSDTGKGIPKEARARIFEAFGQVAAQDATLYGGAGLGLVVVTKLVEAMKGEIELVSEEGQGSCFAVTFTLPYSTAKPQTCVAIQDKIHMVSDNEVLIEGAKAHLSALGQKLDMILRAPVAIDPSHVVLVDRASQTGPNKPPSQNSLILLAPEQRHEIEAWKMCGYSGYLIKPLRKASIGQRLNALNRQDKGHGLPEDDRIESNHDLKAKVLLVEDNPVNALLATLLLQRQGCVVERVSSGEEALLLMARPELASGFDVIFMDLGLPGLDGIGTARQLRADKITTPIIALTANAYEEDRRACLSAGMDDFLTKPIEIINLRQKLLKWASKTD